MSRKTDIYFDGASRGNPGEASYGVIIRSGEKDLSLSGSLGTMTNNEAEYHGLLAALEWCLENQAENVTIFSDSQLVVKQIQGLYRVKSKNLQPLFFRAMEMIRQLSHFRIYYVAREFNRQADSLANRVLDDRASVRENPV